ncbi:MAG: carboxypeptidase regulatory-like domain-containing protein [Candidatus Thermoplasmatota archaeon]|nr:carboxypeptidase regulatory-like domain-containing protein [Candidatus Thermoplasmatota archaeon]
MKIGTIAGIAIAILLIMPLSMNAAAQNEMTGKVYGYVYGDAGDVWIMTYPPPEGKEIPLENATVSIRMSVLDVGLPSTDTKTDKEGYFEFNNLTPGDYEIVVTAEGYKGYYGTFSVAAGDNKSLDKIVLSKEYKAPEQMAPDAKIFGHARNSETGEAIKGVYISISGGYRDGYYGGMPYYGGYNSTYTDADGYYEMGCWSGDNWIYAYPEGNGYKEYNVQINLSSGDNEYNIKLEPKPPKTAKVSGYVYDTKTGKPIWVKNVYSGPVYADGGVSSDTAVSSDGETSSGSGSSGSGITEPSPGYNGGGTYSEYIGASVYLSNQEYSDWNSTTTNENGYFEMWTYPGYSSINIWADGYYSFDLTVDLAGAYEHTFNLKPRPAPDCIIYGTVVNKTSGKPVAGAWVNAWNDETYAYGSIQTDENGSYELKLLHGWNHVSVWADGYFSYSATVDLGANKKTQHDIELKPGGYRYYPILYSDGGNAVKSSAPAAPEEAGISSMQDSMNRQSQTSSSSGGYALDQNAKVEIKDGGIITGIPGFEVLALIGAIGVAMVIARRRK